MIYKITNLIFFLMFLSSIGLAQTTEKQDFDLATQKDKDELMIERCQRFWDNYPNATLNNKIQIAKILTTLYYKTKSYEKSVEFGQFCITNNVTDYYTLWCMAQSYVKLKKYTEAISIIDLAIAASPAYNAVKGRAVKADILYQSGNKEAAFNLVKDKTHREDFVVLIKWETDNAKKETLLNEALTQYPNDVDFIKEKIKVLVAQKKQNEAITLIESLDIIDTSIVNSYIALKNNDSTSIKSIIIKRLKSASYLSDADLLLIINLLPGNDTANLITDNAQQVTNKYLQFIKQSTGRITKENAELFITQLLNGDGNHYLVVTNEAKSLADLIEQSNVSVGPFLTNLLKGNYSAAAKIAFTNAKNSNNTTEYNAWIKCVTYAIRCNDQHYNGRAIAFIKWVNGEIAQNPITDMLE